MKEKNGVKAGKLKDEVENRMRRIEKDRNDMKIPQFKPAYFEYDLTSKTCNYIGPRSIEFQNSSLKFSS
jgi:hypothetical protein